MADTTAKRPHAGREFPEYHADFYNAVHMLVLSDDEEAREMGIELDERYGFDLVERVERRRENSA